MSQSIEFHHRRCETCRNTPDFVGAVCNRTSSEDQTVPSTLCGWKLNQAVMHCWRTHPAALREYERGKYRYVHSKRDYYRWKENLIVAILEQIPD